MSYEIEVTEVSYPLERGRVRAGFIGHDDRRFKEKVDKIWRCLGKALEA